MAMALVTDLGASDIMTSREAPIHLAINTTEIMPTTQPASSHMSIGMNCLRMTFNWV